MIFVVNRENTKVPRARDGKAWKKLWRFSTDERKTAEEYFRLIAEYEERNRP